VTRRVLRVAWYRFRVTLRARWGGLLALVLLIGLLGGLAIGAVAAARRTQSSFPAYLASTNPSDLVVTTAVSSDAFGYDRARIRTISRLRHVRRVQSYAGFLNVRKLGPDGAPVRGGNGSGPQPLLVGSVDGEYFTQDRVSVIKGRMADPKKADEAVMSADAARTIGAHVGAVVDLGFFTDAQSNLPGYGTASVQPYFRVSMRLVGIVVSNDAVIRDDTDRATTFILFTPALTRPLLACCGAYGVSGLQLDGGSRDVAAVEAEIGRALPDLPPNFYVTSIIAAKAERAIKPESIALGVFGAIAALATLLIAGQLIGRQLRAGAADAATLRALGANPAMTMSDGLFGVLGAVSVGSVLASVVAVGLSPLSPLGPARSVDPASGVKFDWTVLGVGLVVLLICLSTVAIGLAYREAPHRVDRRRRETDQRESRVARAAAGTGLPVPAVTGIRFALEPGGAKNSAPVRSAILGAVLAIVVVVATVTFGASLNTLVSHPALYGWNWNYELNSYFGGSSGIPQQQSATLLDHDQNIAAWTGVFYGTLQIDGQTVPSHPLSDPRHATSFSIQVAGCSGGRMSIYWTASFSLCSLRRTKFPIIYTDLRLD